MTKGFADWAPFPLGADLLIPPRFGFASELRDRAMALAFGLAAYFAVAHFGSAKYRSQNVIVIGCGGIPLRIH